MRTRFLAVILVIAACGGSTAAQEADRSSTTRLPEQQASTPTSAAEPAASSSTTADEPSDEATTTTATAERSDSTPPRSGGGGAVSDHSGVAVIGCSQTRDAIFGYNVVAGDLLLGADGEAEYLSAGSVDVWADPARKKWATFSELVDDETDALWIMVCWHVRNSVGSDLETVGSIIDGALERIGRDVPVYISGLNDWSPRSICPKADWEASWALADEVVAAGLAMPGPALGPIAESETRDGCHGNDAGNRIMGEQLATFFGR